MLPRVSDAATLWGAGTYERIAALFAPIQDELVGRLEPAPRVRWLDLATGTGEVALRAARAGADVTGADIAPVQIEKARGRAAEEGLEISFEVADAEALPYDDASFDVLSSNFGFVFAPDHAAVAAELVRVTRPGGRLGFTAWRPNEGLAELYAPFGGTEHGGSEHYVWGKDDHVRELLEESFELELEERPFFVEADSGEDVWELFSTSAPPVKMLADSLDPPRRAEFHQAFVAFYETFREGAAIRAPRPYLLVTGRRR
jgi:ubiquinone/menaquinone biosynthesis C-methylase UbiE